MLGILLVGWIGVLDVGRFDRVTRRVVKNYLESKGLTIVIRNISKDLQEYIKKKAPLNKILLVQSC
jgi:hypothetical protein